MHESEFLKKFNRLIRWVDLGHAFILTVLVGILAVGVMASVIFRYLFGLSAGWAEELLTKAFVATTFIGAALGVREAEHITMSSLAESLPPAVRKVINLIIMSILIIISGFVLRYSLHWIATVGKVPSPASGIPNGLYYLVVPISFGFTIFYAIVNIVAEFVAIDPPVSKSSFSDVPTTAPEAHP